jgi:hypothetical protein
MAWLVAMNHDGDDGDDGGGDVMSMTISNSCSHRKCVLLFSAKEKKKNSTTQHNFQS